MKNVVLFLCLLLLASEGSSQYYKTGSDPGSVRWFQIKTPNFRVIYPKSFEKHAQYIANGMEYYYKPSGNTLNSAVRKTPVILHDQTTIPSSVTPFAPYRTDFFTAPPQDTYAQDWIDQLIIHEFRHSNQYASLNRGFTKGLSFLLGQQATFLVEGLFVPLWFTEGDATVAETAFCNSGRGRVPSFEMRLRAQFLQKGIYSYEKAVNKSYRDMIPGPYELGYQMVGLTREIYGANVWSNVMENVGKHAYSPVPFSHALREQTGSGKYDLYHNCTEGLRKTWSESDRLIVQSTFDIITDQKKPVYTNYNLPVIFRDSMIIAVRLPLDGLPKIVQIDSKNREKTLFTPGVNFAPESLSASDNFIYWSEMIADPRWTLRDFRVIKSYDYNTGKITQLTHRTRYYAPAVSKNGSQLAAVEVTRDNRYSLVILDSKNGSLIKKINTPDNLLFIHPNWSKDDSLIVTAVLGKEGNNLAIIKVATGDISMLLPNTSMEIKRPSFYKNFVIYSASYNGIENFYAVNTGTREIFQVTSARFGASDAYVNDKKSRIIYANYTSDGNQIVGADLIPDIWQKEEQPVKSSFPLAENLSLQENFSYNRDSVPDKIFPSKPYKKALNLFDVHSWAPIGLDIQNYTVSPGVTLLSQNLLGTSLTSLGYLYDRNQKTGKYFMSYTYEGLYPAIDLNVDYGLRKDIYVNMNNDSINSKWRELNLTAGLRLPLKWVKNYWTRSFQPSAGFTFTNLAMDRTIPANFDNNRIVALNSSLYFSNKMKMAYGDLLPRWGQEIRLDFRKTLTRDVKSSILAGEIILDFPGFAKHHGIEIDGSYQKKSDRDYHFPDLGKLPLGFSGIFKNEFGSLFASYSLPLGYPDFQLGHLLYVKRVKATAFYNHAIIMDKLPHEHLISTGLDLRMDLNVVNFITAFDTGLRTIYFPQTRNFGFEFLFSIDLNSLY
jgi:hypothetical protein